MIDWAALAARNAPLNAFVDYDRAGRGGAGPLAGLTIGVKANIAVAGLPWTAGMALYRARIAAADAAVVARLRAAGAVILGTLNMDEAALGATTDNPWSGRTHNPHDLTRTPGGSSGGSGAAVAAALCDAALGTDTLGSVRMPAAYCGVYALKPTHGALSCAGVEPLHPGFDAVGPLARSLDVLAGVFAAMRATAEARPARAPTPRVLALADLGGVACAPAVLAGYDAMRARLPAATPLTLPLLAAVRRAAFVEAARALSARLDASGSSDLVSPALRRLLDHAVVAARDLPLLASVRAALIEALGDDGVLVLPTAPQVAFAHGSRAPRDQADFTCLANIAGLPALALPAGVDADGMPVGVQLVGPAGGEAGLFEIARALAATGPLAVPPPYT